MRVAKTFDHGVAREEGSGISQGYSINGTIYVSGQFSLDQSSVRETSRRKLGRCLKI